MALEAAVGFLLENLNQLLLYNANLILDVKSEIESLHNDLQLLKAFFKETAIKDNNHELMNTPLKQIRDLVYEAEDYVDVYVSQAATHTAQSSSYNVVDATNIRNIAVAIKSMKAEVYSIYRNKEFGFDALPVAVPTFNEKEAPILEYNEMSLEDEAKKLTKLLIEGPDELQVISIFGMPGLGKTFLAQMIYCDCDVEYEFYNRAWVYVSQCYSKKEVLYDILRQFTTPSEADMNEVELENELRNFLKKVKYFIVMDDMWSCKHWDDLKTAFPDNKMKSRIVLTTRHPEVAKYPNPNMCAHQLRYLTKEESTILLRKMVLGSMELPEVLRDPEMRIVQRCHGLPVEIAVIGGILRGVEGKEDSWKEIAHSLESLIPEYPGEKMDYLIEMSFNHLPDHLKACFLYFGIFPIDFQIPVWKLLRLWIAEGFIQLSEGTSMSLEDIAEECLQDFINRNLVMAGHRRSNGKAKTCHITDQIHAFCKQRAAQESFSVEIRQHNQPTYSSSSPDPEMYRRLSINSRISDYLLSKTPTGPRVRSFFCFHREEITLRNEQNSSIPKSFKLLRVLDAKPIHFTRFPVDFTELIHLRYLVLSCNFKILPAVVSKLWNLQTLIIETTSHTLEIKADLGKMLQFRHLKTNVSTTLRGPLRKNREEYSLKLKTLSTISPESCTEDVFSWAPKLNRLGIRGKLATLFDINSTGSSLFDSLEKLDDLESLKLWNDVSPQPPSAGKIISFPASHKFPSKLKQLTIVETMLDWKHMSTLGLLECLEILKLKDNAFMGEFWESENEGFRSLRVLHIGRTDLVLWEASAMHFPRLRCLRLKNCSKLYVIPFELAKVPSFQILDLNCTPNAVDSANKILEHKKLPSGSEFRLSIYPRDDQKCYFTGADNEMDYDFTNAE